MTHFDCTLIWLNQVYGSKKKGGVFHTGKYSFVIYSNSLMSYLKKKKCSRAALKGRKELTWLWLILEKFPPSGPKLKKTPSRRSTLQLKEPDLSFFFQGLEIIVIITSVTLSLIIYFWLGIFLNKDPISVLSMWMRHSVILINIFFNIWLFFFFALVVISWHVSSAHSQ